MDKKSLSRVEYIQKLGENERFINDLMAFIDSRGNGEFILDGNKFKVTVEFVEEIDEKE